MSYVLIDGKRYYKDEKTGKVVLDNVSQAEAERRAKKNQGTMSSIRKKHLCTVLESDRITGNTVNTTGVVRANINVGILWKILIACMIIVLFIGAFIYNKHHVSKEEQKISNYMDEQRQVHSMVENDSVSVKNDQDTYSYGDLEESEDNSTFGVYLMPDSDNRYLQASDIEGRSHDEIQLIINEIYARHGREFFKQKNINYFSTKNWYEPVPGKSDETIANEFNEFEKANVKLLSEYLQM